MRLLIFLAGLFICVNCKAQTERQYPPRLLCNCKNIAEDTLSFIVETEKFETHEFFDMVLRDRTLSGIASNQNYVFLFYYIVEKRKDTYLIEMSIGHVKNTTK